MAITTTEYANFDKKAFFDNREWLNQENWQMYFGGSLPSGVLVKGKLESDGINYTSALTRQVLSNNYIGFRPGSVLVNGIFATYIGGTSIPNIKSADIDRLFVARVYNTAGNVKIIGMTKVAAEYGYTPSVFAKMLLQDESLGCTRNETVYDIPLCYEVFGNDVYDLRRLIYLPGKAPDIEILFSHDEVTNTATIPDILYGRDFIQIYGGMNYNVNFSADDTTEIFYIYPNPACSEKQAVVKLVNASSIAKQIRIPLKWKNLDFSYSWLESWTADPNNQYLYKELIAGDKTTMIFVPNGHKTAFDYTVSNKSSISGGGIDPDDYYTKQEIVDQLLLKANVSDMNEALATKENISNLGTLAYLNQVNYSSQVINKPTLGALASKDKTTLTSDVTGVLPVANGGTGQSSIDTTPTANSSKMVTSGGVKTALDGMVSKSGDTMTGTLTISGDGNTLKFVPANTSKMLLAQIAIRDNERLMFWHRTSNNNGNELYLLPVMNTSATGNNYYDILTSKTPVTVAQGGTGITSNPSMLVNLSSTSAANVLATSPRPGVTGVLPVANGGTGATSINSIANSVYNIIAITNLYVNKITGDDSTGDGTSSNPFKTIQKAINSAHNNGETIINITPEEYNENITIKGKNIVFTGTSSSEIKITSNSSSNNITVNIENANVIFRGTFTITGYYCAIYSTNSYVLGVSKTSGDYLKLIALNFTTASNIAALTVFGGIFSTTLTFTIVASGNGIQWVVINHSGFISLGSLSLSGFGTNYWPFYCYNGVIICGTNLSSYNTSLAVGHTSGGSIISTKSFLNLAA